MKICLVTGGAGFVGANLVRSLVALGHRVHIVVEPQSSLWRLAGVVDRIIVHEIDLTQFTKINQMIEHIAPEWIFHLASYGGMPEQNDQDFVYYINFDCTRNLLDACARQGFECFINTGSSSEYGIQQQGMSELTPLAPVSDYGVAKAAATQYCAKRALADKLPVYTVRPFSVYGEYEAPTRFIPTLVQHALAGTAMNLSSPDYVRDFIYVQDLVDLYLAIAKKSPFGHTIFNGGTGVETSLGRAVQVAQSVVELPLQVAWNASEPRPWEPKHWKADCSLAQHVLGWKAQYSFEKGLKKTILWFKQHGHVYQASPDCQHELKQQGA